MQKVVLITGVSSGIGAATAAALANAGYRVFGGARRPEQVSPIGDVELVQLDVRDSDQVRDAVAHIVMKAGRLDTLINNAGVSLVGPVEATSEAEAQALFDTNVFGVLRVTQTVLPVMRKQRSGLIINVSSVLGFLPAPFMGLYAASKHAVEGLSESLDHEVREFGIRVMLVEPNFTNTKLDANSTQVATSIAAYADRFARTGEALGKQIAAGTVPSAVADRIRSAIEGKYKMRHPADRGARILALLKRFAPSPLLDKGIRSTFGLPS